MAASDTSVALRRAALTTPRAAAVAGIVFGILYGASLVFVRAAIPVEGAADRGWVDANAHLVHLALNMVPYAGIAFLWFIGVIRDRLGGLEDRFFATIFLGSGLLFVALTFIGAALAGGLMTSYQTDQNAVIASSAYSYGRAVMYNVVNVYAIRMAGVFMVSLASIWMRTALMHRAWALATYALALVLLVSDAYYPQVFLIFPGWVLAVSVYLLIRNARVRPNNTLDEAGAG